MTKSGNRKPYEMLFVFNGDIDPQLKYKFNTLTHYVSELEQDLTQLKKIKALDELARDANKAKREMRSLRDDAHDLSQVFDQTLQFTGAYTVISAIGDKFSSMVNEVMALDDSMYHMGAATGATAEEMANFKGSIEDLYAQNLGEGFQDIANALVQVQRTTKLSGSELEKTTKHALMLRDTFGYEVNESVRSADMLMRQFGVTSEQAYNLIAQGSQKGLDKTGELLDSINEFTPQFNALGFTANEMFDFFSSGLDAGAWNLDKVGDLVKEFDNRLKDAGDTASREALASLFGEKQSMELLDQVSKGALSGADALDLILKKLAAIDRLDDRQTLGIAIMGTQYEDLGQKVVNSLTDVERQFDKTQQTMQQIEELKHSSLTKDIQLLGRELMTEVIIPIGEDLMPVLHDLTDWASDNKELIKTLSLAVPAGMLAKNTFSMTQNLTRVGKSLFETTNGVSKFGSMMGMLTHPVGLAVGAVGALTLGVMAYKKHQEAARQELLHMGDALDQAYDDYSAVDEQTQKTKQLINEYDRLTGKIENAKTPADELTEARRKLSLVEQELIDLNPDILRAEDAKSDRFREQLKLVDQLNATQSEMARRELDMSVMEGKDQLPDLIAEYDELNQKLAESDAAYLKAKESYAAYTEYMNQHQAIVSNKSLSSDEMNNQLRQLAKEMEAVTGKDYSNNFASIYDDAKRAKQSVEDYFNSWKNAQSEIQTAEGSIQSLYDNQKKLIELDLGASIEEQAAKYKQLSAEEKRRFDAALQQIRDLNSEMSMLGNKRINVDMIYRQINGAPKLAKHDRFGPSIRAYARGGIVNRPELALVGEGGDREFIIPDNNSKRSHDLYAAAGEALGYRTGTGGNFAPVFSPQITIQGNADEQVIRRVVDETYRNWMRNLTEWQRQQQRVMIK